jgi:hypothetical protein
MRVGLIRREIPLGLGILQPPERSSTVRRFDLRVPNLFLATR